MTKDNLFGADDAPGRFNLTVWSEPIPGTTRHSIGIRTEWFGEDGQRVDEPEHTTPHIMGCIVAQVARQFMEDVLGAPPVGEVPIGDRDPEGTYQVQREAMVRRASARNN